LPLTKSASAERMASNLDIFDFELAEEDIKALDNLEGYPDPFPHPDNIYW